MTTLTKRATVYFDPALHRILKLKALDTERSISDIIDEAIRLELAEDANDLAAMESRELEPTISYEELIKDLQDNGKL